MPFALPLRKLEIYVFKTIVNENLLNSKDNFFPKQKKKKTNITITIIITYSPPFSGREGTIYTSLQYLIFDEANLRIRFSLKDLNLS